VTVRRCFVLAVLALSIAAVSEAQDFGVMESAETINRGNVKLGAYPMFILPDAGENQTGVGLQVGYGAADSLDIEGRAAFFDDVTFVGGDVEVWLIKNQPLDLSARGGFHFGLADRGRDTRGVDLGVIASAPVAERVEVYGALDMAFNSVDNTPRDFNTVHIVPGIEAAVATDLDFLVEVGLGVNDDSSNYVAVGLSYYFR
jgi:hypothetical protein